MPIEHSISQRPQLLQRCGSEIKRIGDILFDNARKAPIGQKYSQDDPGIETGFDFHDHLPDRKNDQ